MLRRPSCAQTALHADGARAGPPPCRRHPAEPRWREIKDSPASGRGQEVRTDTF